MLSRSLSYCFVFLDLGCCWDLTKERHCFHAAADARIPNNDDNGNTAGFAAGMTALSFIIIYAVLGAGYYVFYVR